MPHIPDVILSLLNSGCNVTLTQAYIPEFMIRMAEAAKRNNVQLTIEGSKLIPEVLYLIAKAGGKNVTIIS